MGFLIPRPSYRQLRLRFARQPYRYWQASPQCFGSAWQYNIDGYVSHCVDGHDIEDHVFAIHAYVSLTCRATRHYRDIVLVIHRPYVSYPAEPHTIVVNDLNDRLNTLDPCLPCICYQSFVYLLRLGRRLPEFDSEWLRNATVMHNLDIFDIS